MNILITGASGFLGTHCTQALRQDRHNLTLVDITPPENEGQTPNCRFERLDIRREQNITDLIRGMDIVIHAAAALPLWKRDDIFSTNVDGTRNILSAALDHRVKRVVYISSTAVYGIPEKHPIMESDRLMGVGPYGESKILAEKLCLNFMKKGLNVTILRPKTFLGTGRLGVFEILFDWVHDGKRIPVIGNGHNLYQLLAVDDLVEVITRCVQNSSQEYNDVFNVAAETFGTVKNDLDALFDFAQSGSRLQPTPAGLVKGALHFFEMINLSPLYQWVYDTADKDSFVSIDKLKNTFQWTPRFSNAQILIKTYDWYSQNYTLIKSRRAGITHTAAWKQGLLGLVKKFM